MIRTILGLQFRFVRSPKKAISQLEHDPRAAFVGFTQILFLAVIWEIAILLWALGGASVTMPAFLKIPEDRYYFYQLIFFIPMFFVSWLLASGAGYVLSKALGGKGSFDTVLGAFGIAATISGYFALVPDLVQGVLWTTRWVPFGEYQELTSHGFLAVIESAYLFAYTVSHLALYGASVHYALGLSWPRSALVSVAAYIVSAGVFIVINR